MFGSDMQTVKYRLIGALLCVVLFHCRETMPTAPNHPSPGSNAQHDPRIAGEWVDYDLLGMEEIRKTVTFNIEDGEFLWSTMQRAKGDTVDPVYEETEYMTGTWATINDTLLLSYSNYVPVWDYRQHRSVDSLMYSVDSYQIRYRLNDAGLLAISENGVLWTYYFPTGNGADTGEITDQFRAVAPVDTSVAVFDTIELVAGNVGADTTVSRYVWSFNGGRTYDDTIKGPVVQVVWQPKHAGLQICAVKAIDEANRVSAPDYVEIEVHTYKPIITAVDSILLCNDSIPTLSVSGLDSNGIVKAYLWTIRNAQVPETTTTGAVSLTLGCLQQEPVSVRCMDEDNLISEPVSFTARRVPARSYGTNQSEVARAVVALDSTTIVLGQVDVGKLYEVYIWAAQIDNHGVMTRSAHSYADRFQGTYGLNFTQDAALVHDVGLLVVGVNDDSYSVVNNGFLVCLDDTLGSCWSKTFRDDNAKGTGLTDIAVGPNSEIVLAGYSVYDTCTRRDDGSQTCRYYKRPYCAKVSGNGTTLWERTYDYEIGYQANVAAEYSNGVLMTSDSILIRTDAQGEELWSKIWPRQIHDITGTANGVFVLITSATGNVEVKIEWISHDGQVLRNLDLPGFSDPQMVVALSDNSVLAVAQRALARVSSEGILSWTLEAKHYTFAGAAELPDGSICIAGSTKEYGAGESDAVMLCVDRNGRRLW